MTCSFDRCPGCYHSVMLVGAGGSVGHEQGTYKHARRTRCDHDCNAAMRAKA